MGDGAEHAGAWRISEVDPRDPVAFREWFDVMSRAASAGREDPVVWEHDDLRTHVLLREASSEWRLVVARDAGGVAVGTGSLDLPLHEDLDLAEVDVAVAVAHRRGGVGSVLLADLLRRARAAGRTRTTAGVAVPSGAAPCPGAAFAEAAGLRLAHEEEHLVLGLPLPEVVRDRAEAVVAARPGAGSVVVWSGATPGATPDAHAADHAALRARFSVDVPSGDLGREPERWDVARLRASGAAAAGQGHTVLVAAALDDQGSMVGCSRLVVTAEDLASALQASTFVREDHRGHGLVTAMKLRMIEHLETAAPAVGVVHTWTDEGNVPMSAVNRRLGFRVVETSREYVLAGW